MWRQRASSLGLALLCGCVTRPPDVSEASLPPEGPADLILQEVAFARFSDGEISSRGTAEELTYRRSAGRLLASQAALRLPPHAGSGLAPLGLLFLAAPRVEAETSARRGVGSQGVRLDAQRGDRARTDRVFYDGARQLVTSDTAFSAQGPGYRVRSLGFIARADGNEVQLVGGVAGRLDGAGR
jgi:hypothetical protein